MPIYEYTCDICSNTFDKLRAISQMDDAAPCPDCGSESRRQLSVFAAFSTGGSGESSSIAGCGSACCGGGPGGCPPGCSC